MLICFMDWLEHLIWMRTRWWWNLLLSNNSYTMPQALKASISLKARCKWTMNTLSHLADLFQRPRTARWFQSKYCDSSYTCAFLLISPLFSCRKLLRQLDDLSEQALTPKADHMHRFKTMYALSTKLSKFCFEVFIWRLTLFYTRIQWLMYMCNRHSSKSWVIWTPNEPIVKISVCVSFSILFTAKRMTSLRFQKQSCGTVASRCSNHFPLSYPQPWNVLKTTIAWIRVCLLLLPTRQTLN